MKTEMKQDFAVKLNLLGIELNLLGSPGHPDSMRRRPW